MTDNRVVDVFVEIPTGSQNKYEYDEDQGVFKLDRVLYSPMHYPTEYGYIDNTLALDGDPLDVLVYTTFPTFPGCVIESRIIGVLNMSDDKGQDEKLLAVPTEDPRFDDVNTLNDVPKHVLDEIGHFFKVYKDLENKETKIGDWEGPEKAAQLVDECIERAKG
ncbi:inorganic diphosphatase [Tuberibacillus sp. Marseille-P3662]|uniref:inorganic diphosphatase n=1 Tax=Tuberibacillus sp. Marseille-P3662 TaxID=1965358 RepID=UPI000A1CDA5F|nr:inorganic diphosphatase [Tuberibacillus sp. Marseille-P3662]